jgi:NAD(P)-dependent dehydrogenase (short-subunit alcohol dehydrogenase family)
MSRVPMGSARGPGDPFGPSVTTRFEPGLIPQGISAELVAARWGITRDMQDEYALGSHRPAGEAASSGFFDRETVAVQTPNGLVKHDESIRRDSSLEKLAALPESFRSVAYETRFPEIEWSVTAGNASQITDGAAAILMTSRRAATRLGLPVRAQVAAAVGAARKWGPLRALVHCAARGGPVRVVESDGTPGSLEDFETIVGVNLFGTFNVLRLAAAAMVSQEPLDGERGVCILTSSIAAWEGQISQTPYAASKAAVVGMTLVAARDLASRLVRVNTIAPGLFDTPILARFNDDIRQRLAASTPNPSRLGNPDEFAALAIHILETPMLNGETVRLDGALRMAPR